MKPITNILLVASLIAYIFLPLFEVSFDGSWTGLNYTAQTISNSTDLLKIAFSLIPFLAGFGAIAINCMKNRYWGLASAALIGLGLFFYIDAKDLIYIQSPEFYAIKNLGWGFDVGYGLMFAAFVSAVVSVLPFSFNKFLAHEIRTLTGKKSKDNTTSSTPTQGEN